MSTQTPTHDMAVISHRIGALHDDFAEMKSVLRDLAAAITKLALIEERQSHAALEQSRTIKVLEKLETRIDILEKDAPLQAQTSNWVLSAVWAAAGLSVMFIGKKLGLI